MSNSPARSFSTPCVRHPLCDVLADHSLYAAIRGEADLRVFMEHHVFAVWDFMSLIKSLQEHLAPVRVPWTPPVNPRHARFINQLVMEEESDDALSCVSGVTHCSHFESYCQAMEEVGADVEPIRDFIEQVKRRGAGPAIETADIPEPARQFMTFTFDVIGRHQPHLSAAALAYGRESLVPALFQSLLARLRIGTCHAPILHGYIERHIQLDGQEHGPLAVQMVQELCEGSEARYIEAQQVAEQALAARLGFWNGIHRALTG